MSSKDIDSWIVDDVHVPVNLALAAYVSPLGLSPLGLTLGLNNVFQPIFNLVDAAAREALQTGT
jgi:hypothetical protein